MATVESTGTQSASVGTEHTLYHSTAFKTYLSRFSLSAMLSSESGTTGSTGQDVVELRIYAPIFATATSTSPANANLVYYGTYVGVQVPAIKESIPVVAPAGVLITLKQVNGTGRSYDWGVISL